MPPPTVTGAIPQRPADSHINIEYPDDQPPATQPPEVPDVPTIPEDPDIPDIPDDPILPEDGVLSGYYFNAAEVQDDPDGVLQQLQQLPAGTAVLVQLVLTTNHSGICPARA